MKMAELVEKRLEMVGGTIGEEPAGTKEMMEVEVPLVQKRRNLVKAGQAEPAQEGLTIETIEVGGDGG